MICVEAFTALWMTLSGELAIVEPERKEILCIPPSFLFSFILPQLPPMMNYYHVVIQVKYLPPTTGLLFMMSTATTESKLEHVAKIFWILFL